MGFLVGNCDARFSGTPRDQWAVDFLPYAPDSEVEGVIGYPNPNKGYGYGTWCEFYATETEARARFEFLKTSGVIERVELLHGPRGACVDEWKDA